MYWIKTKSGEEYPIRFDQEAMSLFAMDNNLSYDDMTKMSLNFTKWPIKLFYAYLIACFEEPCREKNKDFPYKDLRDFNKWINSDDTILAECMKYWIESQPKPEEGKKQTQTVRKGR